MTSVLIPAAHGVILWQARCPATCGGILLIIDGELDVFSQGWVMAKLWNMLRILFLYTVCGARHRIGQLSARSQGWFYNPEGSRLDAFQIAAYCVAWSIFAMD